MPQVGFEFLREFETLDDGLILRRYVADWKFNDLLSSRSLYFAPASQFSDKLEGHYTHLDNELSEQQLARWGLDFRSRGRATDARKRVAEDNQKAVVVCCWTAGNDENLRMWSEAAQSPESIALETRVGDLRRALGSDFLIIPVTYLDFPRDMIPKEHSLQPFFFKQQSFAWEREVRVVGEMEVGQRIESSRPIPIDLNLVLQKVIVSPFASETYSLSVKSRLAANSVCIPVHASTLR